MGRVHNKTVSLGRIVKNARLIVIGTFVPETIYTYHYSMFGFTKPGAVSDTGIVTVKSRVYRINECLKGNTTEKEIEVIMSENYDRRLSVSNAYRRGLRISPIYHIYKRNTGADRDKQVILFLNRVSVSTKEDSDEIQPEMKVNKMAYGLVQNFAVENIEFLEEVKKAIENPDMFVTERKR